jgi:hypothetical protein
MKLPTLLFAALALAAMSQPASAVSHGMTCKQACIALTPKVKAADPWNYDCPDIMSKDAGNCTYQDRDTTLIVPALDRPWRLWPGITSLLHPFPHKI